MDIPTGFVADDARNGVPCAIATNDCNRHFWEAAMDAGWRCRGDRLQQEYVYVGDLECVAPDDPRSVILALDRDMKDLCEWAPPRLLLV